MHFTVYLKEITTAIPRLALETGQPVLRLYMNFVRCYLLGRASLANFQGLELYNLSPMGFGNMLTCRRMLRLMKRVNKGAGAEDFAVFNRKPLFNKTFRDFVRRDWLYLPEASEEEFRTFLARNQLFLLKPADGMQGQGISLYRSDELDPEKFLETHREEKALLEAFIAQHPALSDLNPSSVNTIRISTVRHKGRVLLLGAGLRCGAPSSHVDNFSAGGSAYPVDLDTGVVFAPGKSLRTAEPQLRNPAGDRILPGFAIPHWECLKAAVLRAALVPERVGYIAWDIAITEDGVDFVEGNAAFPGSTIIQLGNRGVYRRLQSFLREL